MRTFLEWMHRLAGTVHAWRRDDELAEELRLHTELAAEDARRRGLDADDAARAARFRTGGAAQAMDALRDQRGLPWLDDVARDVRYGLRVLRRSPMFTIVAMLSLALGIGANAAIFHLIDTISFRTLPVPAPHELAEIRADGTDAFGITEGANARVTYPLWEEIRAHQRAFTGLFAWGNAFLLVGRGADARAADGLWVSGEFFDVLGIEAQHGRLLTASDDSRGCGAGAAVVSHDFWRATLGGNETVVGNTLTILEQPFTVVGVTPPGFRGLEVGRSFDIALPLCSTALWNGNLEMRDRWWLTVMGRLRNDWTVARADAHMRALSAGLLAATVPSGYSAELLEQYHAFQFGVLPAGRGVSRLREAHGTSLPLLLGLTGLVLVITCANLATLMLARAAARERETAVRVAIGASRGRLVSQLTIESLLVATAGAAAAVPVAVACAHALVRFLDTTANPVTLPLAADWRLIAFVGGAGVVATILFGLMPALRVSMIDPLMATRQTSRGLPVDRRRARLRRGLVVCQVALSVVLIVAAVLFVRSFRNLASIDVGFARDGIQVASFLDLPSRALPVEQRVAFQQQLLAEVRSVPGVAAAAASSHIPLAGGVWAHFFKAPRVSGAETKVSRFAYVSPGYFGTLKIPVVAGRDFDERDTAASPRVLVVNQSFARTHFGGIDPIGATVETVAEAGYPATRYEVVGIIGDTKYADMRDESCWCDAGNEPMPPIAYVPLAQDPSPFPWAAIVVRLGGPAAAVAPAIVERVTALNPAIVVNVADLASQIRERLAIERMVAWLAGAFGVLAIVLVTVGLYGIIAYLAVGRRNEIGVRLSLGSTRGQIVRLVMRESAWMLALGLLIGIPLAAGAMRGAGALLFGLTPTDLPTIAGAASLLAAIAGIAAGIPAWRASRLDPNVVLRAD